MADARLDPFTGRWVILAPGRAQRPDTIAQHVRREEDATPRDRGDCPFCPGNEHLTPPELTRTGPGAAGAPGWRTRVFPNRYPIVDGPRTTPDPGGDRLRVGGAASGAHEVLVLSPDHRRSLADLDSDQVVEVLTVMRDRARFHATTGRTFTQVIVNHGIEGGASLAHPHAQIIASDLEPPAVLDEAARIATAGGCLVCAELERHRGDPALVVAVTEADVWCPWWSGTAFETVVAPRLHRPRFEDADEELSTLGELLRDGLAGLDRTLGDPPYNLAIHSLPSAVAADYHWHIHVWPRLQREAGFERGSGLLVNIVDPARAAALLRESRQPGDPLP
jgi:UDPglucose--hexose-1-phosphate uridylyltransferase